LLAWDMETGQTWRVERPGGQIQWPCFAENGGLYWRVRQGEPPYAQEILALDEAGATPRTLPLGHDERCDDGPVIQPAARFARGRKRVGLAPSLEGPGLPGGRVELPETVIMAAWSWDGQVGALLMESRNVRFYSPESGLTPNRPIDPNSGLVVSPTGDRIAYLTGVGAATEFVIRSVPSNDLVARGRGGARVVFDGRGRLLLLRDHRLIRFDADTGVTEVLFPPPAD